MSKHARIVPALDYKGALLDACKKLSPIYQLKNPVIFTVYLGSLICSFSWAYDLFLKKASSFDLQITLWLWATVYFAQFAESLAERKGKAQADSLRKTKSSAKAHLKSGEEIAATQLCKGMVFIATAGDIIPADGDIIEGMASIDESAITGESAPVIREAGSDRSSVMAGTRVLSDSISVEVTVGPGESYLDKMIGLIEGAKRGPTPNEMALNICLSALTLLFLITVLDFKFIVSYIEESRGENAHLSITILSALIVCLIPTTISGLLSAIGISGMERLLRKNVLAKSGKAVEAAGDVDVLLLDKTGTITLGARMAVEFFPVNGISPTDLAHYAALSSLEDVTPEGKSILTLAASKYKSPAPEKTTAMVAIPFTAETRMSGIDLLNDKGEVIQKVRKGAVEAIVKWVGHRPQFQQILERAAFISREGGTPLLVALDNNILGAIYLKDIIKTGIRERFAQLRQIGIRTVMVTGDNPLTAATIAAEAGVDDFIAEATPEAKLKRIMAEQEKGYMVAMVGDGTNDAPALAQADIGVAMNAGTQAAKEAANMVDLDSDPTKLLEIVDTGKELLMARGALTTFSIANDIAKYFTILPAILSGLFIVKGKSLLGSLDILQLSSAQSAILSAVIFNALIILLLIPLALRGTGKHIGDASTLLRRNVLLYGVGGVVCPFVLIKVIDLFVSRFLI